MSFSQFGAVIEPNIQNIPPEWKMVLDKSEIEEGSTINNTFIGELVKLFLYHPVIEESVATSDNSPKQYVRYLNYNSIVMIWIAKKLTDMLRLNRGHSHLTIMTDLINELKQIRAQADHLNEAGSDSYISEVMQSRDQEGLVDKHLPIDLILLFSQGLQVTNNDTSRVLIEVLLQQGINAKLIRFIFTTTIGLDAIKTQQLLDIDHLLTTLKEESDEHHKLLMFILESGFHTYQDKHDHRLLLHAIEKGIVWVVQLMLEQGYFIYNFEKEVNDCMAVDSAALLVNDRKYRYATHVSLFTLLSHYNVPFIGKNCDDLYSSNRLHALTFFREHYKCDKVRYAENPIKEAIDHGFFDELIKLLTGELKPVLKTVNLDTCCQSSYAFYHLGKMYKGQPIHQLILGTNRIDIVNNYFKYAPKDALNVNMVIFQGNTILHELCLHSSNINYACKLLSFLIGECGADITIENDDGLTPLGLTIKYGKLEAAKIILDSGKVTCNDTNKAPLGNALACDQAAIQLLESIFNTSKTANFSVTLQFLKILMEYNMPIIGAASFHLINHDQWKEKINLLQVKIQDIKIMSDFEKYVRASRNS
ncbi:hypothetical protein ACFL96_15500 [Thermoproteota archaeon]